MDVRHNESTGGLSLYVCIGWYGGFKLRRDGPSIRLTLGFIGIGFLWRDIERWIVKVLKIDNNPA